MRVEQHSYGYNYRGRFVRLHVVREYDMEIVYTAEQDGRYYVIYDGGPMADFVDEEDLNSLVRIWEFDTAAAREAFINEKYRPLPGLS